MKPSLFAALAAFLMSSLVSSARADNPDPNGILDKAIKALGGEEKLGKAATYTTKSKGKFFFGGNESAFSSQATHQGLDHYRSDFDGEFNGNPVKGVTVLQGDKGWRKFGDNDMDLDASGVANEKRTVYLNVIPAILLPAKGKGFKLEAAGEEKVGDKPAVAIKVTAPDGKDFKLQFDKETGMPVKLVANVVGFDGQEFTLETTYADYKDFDGIKKATKIESKRDGEKIAEMEVTEFKVLDKVPADTFSQPK
jgi:hypothetical protein